ncbi:S1 family peptidase [Haloechinothrix sp. LS1_15]|uniref:S1 family peptidase n=1 Tax=Haloechinothrix sp. LS1_15 TaxID=2652248 RepID=UPI002947EF9C|nr:S1 family peptidase [Haloechinothrix sp. LS1_15]MDV6013402.1 S1 family peptidase [Haloechinothrix sp. LS1_15]
MKMARAAGTTGAAVMVFGVLTVGAIPAGASSEASPADPANGSGPSVSTEVLDAVQQDLGTTRSQAAEQLASQATATTLRAQLDDALGEAFGGAYYDEASQELVVGVTDPAEVARVTSAGAEATVVRHSMEQLDNAVTKLNREESAAPETVTGWGIDTTTNSVTITVAEGATGDAKSFAARAGVAPSKVAVEESAEQPKLLNTVRGGEAYFMPRSRCSVGFSVQGGFLTAGHCPAMGGTTLSKDGRHLGTANQYRFPGADWALARVTRAWTPLPQVVRLGTVRGAQEAPIGARACKSGSTSGVTCGTIQAKNQTVRYPQGAVFGMTQTSIHARPGDSGGSVMAAGGQAQGMVSGGSQTTMYFEPIQRALRATGARLLTG